MPTPHAHAGALARRDVRLAHDPRDAGWTWFGDDAFVTRLLDAYTLLVPQGEAFVIRTCRSCIDAADPALEAALEGLFHQEGGHAREHAKVRRAMRARGLGLDGFVRLAGFVSRRLLEPVLPRRALLAAAAAIEHLNAAIAAHFLGRDRLRAARVPQLRALFLWHFVEEIEHKAVVFDLLLRVAPGRATRAAGLVLGAATFLGLLVLGTLLLAARTRVAFRARFWRDALVQVAGRDGLVRALGRAAWRYLEPGFHPDTIDDRDLLAAARADLACLGVDRAAPRAADCPLPPAWRESIAPFLERSREVEARHPFFFERIDGHEGACVRSGGTRKVNFCTYSYLGLLDHPRVRAAAARAIERYGTGTHGVRLLGGNLDLHERLESRLAAFHGRPAAITFSSGFVTNVAVIPALLGPGDFVLSDARNHASIVDGCRLSRARRIRFAHNDVDDLARRLGALPAGARKLIVVDAVFSMDGDIAPVDALLALRDRHPNTMLMVDEAHSLGVLGEGGRGIEEHFGCRGRIDILMGTLSKTLPAQGGFVAGSGALVRYLRYHARGFVFSAALAPASAAAALAGLDVIEREGGARRARLVENARDFTGRLAEAGFDVGATGTAIVPVLLGSEPLAFEMARRCHAAGVYAMPVAFPAVARGTERLRMNVTSAHRREDLDLAVRVLVEAREAIGREDPAMLRAGPA